MVYKLLFPSKANATNMSLLLLAARIIFAGLLMTHGFEKLTHFDETMAKLGDPIGMGAEISAGLAIFGEFFCSLACVFGFLYRLSMIPMIVTMCVAFFIAHGASFAKGGEMAFVYLAVFVLIYIAGPGKYSLDYLIGEKLTKKRR
ncbi:MAG: DoxX family protein [Mediterranea sp.]|jgi:putative oxidoreductase|nr:DoxX family protein [Mediterranea sp.]